MSNLMENEKLKVDNDLPNGWVETTLGEMALINPKESLKKGEIVTNIPMTCLDNFSKKIQSFDKKEFKGGTKFRNGDTLLSRITPCLENGKTAYVDILDKNEIGFGSTEYIVIREKEKISDKHFLFYFSISPKFREIAIKLMTGTSGRQRVQTKSLMERKFFFPPLPEQKAIATILTAFDDKIELLQAQNKTLETTAQTIFKEWFGKYQIGDELPEGDALSLPKGWRVGKITELFEVKDGTHDSPKQSQAGKKLITSKHLTNNKLKFEEAYLISEDDFNNINKRSAVHQYDILFSMIGTIGLTYFELNKNIDYAIKNVALFKTSQNKKWANYTYLWLSSFLGKQFVETNKSGSTQEYVSLTSLRNIKFIIPTDEMLNKFNNLTKPIFNKIYNNSLQIQTLKQTRDTLLPKLMSGQLRVKL